MAKIEIKGSPEELDRISTFLQRSNIKFKMLDDYRNHSIEDFKKYNTLVEKFK